MNQVGGVALVLGVLPGTGLLSGCCFSIWGFKKSSWKDMELGPGHCRDRKLGTPWYLPNPTQVAVGRPETSQEGMDKGTQARRGPPSGGLKVGWRLVYYPNWDTCESERRMLLIVTSRQWALTRATPGKLTGLREKEPPGTVSEAGLCSLPWKS